MLIQRPDRIVGQVQAVVPILDTDIGCCALSQRWPMALWPILRQPALGCLMHRLSQAGVRDLTLSTSLSRDTLDDAIARPWPLEVRIAPDGLLAGTGGALRAVGLDEEDDTFIVVLPANLVMAPDVRQLVAIHQQANADLTLFVEPVSADTPSRVFVCRPELLDHIPEQGYWDIKERVIPELVLCGKKVYQATLPFPAGTYYDYVSYRTAVCNGIEALACARGDLVRLERQGSAQIWTEGTVQIHDTARMIGPVLLLEGSCVDQEATLVGPAVIGPGSYIGRGSAVVRSVLWDRVRVGSRSLLSHCVIGHDALVGPGVEAEGEAIAGVRRSRISGTTARCVAGHLNGLHLTGWTLGALVGLAGAFLWSFWSVVKDLWNVWMTSDEYSSGLLVPVMAVGILWSRRRDLAEAAVRPCWLGLILVAGAVAMRLYGLFDLRSSLERLSIVVGIMGLVLGLAGTGVFRKTLTTQLFLVLMLPWPHRIHAAVALPLQEWSTSSAVFGLEMLGYGVVRDGNVIHIGETTVAVAEACNGLRMITAFFVITGLVVLLIRRQWWEKLVVMVSSLPIALVCNTIRLILTSIAFTLVKGEAWEKGFHDFGGYAMMPLALGMVVLDLWILRLLFVPPDTQERVVIKRQ